AGDTFEFHARPDDYRTASLITCRRGRSRPLANPQRNPTCPASSDLVLQPDTAFQVLDVLQGKGQAALAGELDMATGQLEPHSIR
ncbi:MAG: hypothetical protein VYD25_14140, partial [Pseudomonadota bacterium]|nr:hypothetical protein [Pseudomonadota bacterium]